MMKKNIFDELINCFFIGLEKWDVFEEIFGVVDVLFMWVVDMDFVVLLFVIEVLQIWMEYGIFGYIVCMDIYYEVLRGWME